jgi:mevalonate kinase
MPAFTASAPGKIILFGEHAVVYGHSAIAVPVTQVRVKVTVTPDIRGEAGGVRIEAPDVGLTSTLAHLPAQDPIRAAIHGLLDYLGVDRLPACSLKINSTIPIAAGLGSGTAVSVAILRALGGFLGQLLPDKAVSNLAYEVEKIHHGTPSGIDNTVVTYARPVFFTQGQPIHTFQIAAPFTIVIGDTGTPSSTREAVGDVRAGWEADSTRYERLFAAIGSIARTARQVIERGYPERLGPLMDENHQLLQEMGVSSSELDQLNQAAKDSGALGAKLSGGGRGGNMIALVDEQDAGEVSEALRKAGAVNTITTTVI